MLDFQKGQYGKRRQGLFGGGVWQTLPQPGAHDGTGGHELCCQEAPLIECDGSVSSGFCFAGGGAGCPGSMLPEITNSVKGSSREKLSQTLVFRIPD